MNRLFVALAIAGAVAAVVPAAAEPFVAGASVREWTVRHADLDLSSDRDAGIMLQRLLRASALVCAMPELERPSYVARRAMAACEAETLAEAVRDLNAPAVTRQYEARLTEIAYTR